MRRKKTVVLQVSADGARPVQIPQAEVDQNAPLGGMLRKPDAGLQAGRRVQLLIGLEGLQGKIHLVQSRSCQQGLLRSAQKCGVGGQNNTEAHFPGYLQKPSQLRMQQRLTHEMKIQVFRPATKAGQYSAKVFYREAARHAAGLRAEAAVQIADVGDLHVDLGKAHFLPPLTIFDILYHRKGRHARIFPAPVKGWLRKSEKNNL